MMDIHTFCKIITLVRVKPWKLLSLKPVIFVGHMIFPNPTVIPISYLAQKREVCDAINLLNAVGGKMWLPE